MEMLTRRDWIRTTAATGAALSLSPQLLRALQGQELISRAIPASGEQVPIIGLGSSATFRRVAGSGEVEPLGEVLRTFVDKGARVFDTAPSYGESEEVAGELAAGMGFSSDIFWATKVNVARGGSADPAAARAQIERSFGYFGVDTIDLIQVHNLGDPPTQLGILAEEKAAGRVRYIGITSTSERRYPDLAAVMRNEPIDFIGVDYAVDNRASADMILPLAQELGIGVLVYAPFGRTRLWNRVSGRDVPEWAGEFDAHSWAQFFLKFTVAHPAVTCVTPATSRPEHMIDNLGGGMGGLPDESQLERMVQLVEDLPPA
jgi:aryl-alcohol dehydrogenase-like predicted oxidoreductase